MIDRKNGAYRTMNTNQCKNQIPVYEDITQPRNWVTIASIRTMNEEQKISHVSFLIKKLDNPGDSPNFLKLIYLLRVQCLVRLYFPRLNRFRKYALADYTKHPAWNEKCTQREKNLILSFLMASIEHQRNPVIFEQADQAFSRYRHDKWLYSKGYIDSY